MVVIPLFASAMCWVGSQCCNRTPTMQPAKMTHMTSTARQTKVIVNPQSASVAPGAWARAKHKPAECTILRATQAFQALRLIFLQLGRDAARQKPAG
jgi:hypothetical protein